MKHTCGCQVWTSPSMIPHNQLQMYRLQLSLVPTNYWQEQSDSDYFPLPLPLLPNPFIVMQANPIPWCEGFYGSPFCAGPQDMPVPHWQQWQHQYHDQPPSSGPSRTRAKQQKRAFRKAGVPYSSQKAGASSGTVGGDRSNNNTRNRIGKVWRTPSKNLLMIDHKT